MKESQQFASSSSQPQGWTLGKLAAKHASVPWNPDLANIFFRAAYLEAWERC